VQTPNADSLRAKLGGANWNMLIADYHFHLPSIKRMQSLLSECGFEVRLLKSVSGSGQEQGILRLGARLKESLLSMFRLGNALFVLADRK